MSADYSHWWKPLTSRTPGSYNKRPGGAVETMRNFAITCIEIIYVKELSNLSAESFSSSTGDDVTEEDLKSTPNLEMQFEMHRKMCHIFGQCFTAFQQPRNRSHKMNTKNPTK